MTEIIRDTDRLIIKWKLANGDGISIIKWFDYDKQMQPAEVGIWHKASKSHHFTSSALRVRERELHYAAAVAETVDAVFTDPADFDRIVVDNDPAVGDYPAQIFPRDDGKIHILIAGNL